MTDIVARRLVVTGKVQGVFFRANTERVARELGLRGWVTNADDGAVEIHAEGSRDALDRLIAWCREGPPGAKVDGVSVDEANIRGLPSFDVYR
jgi:acylphosphatase